MLICIEKLIFLKWKALLILFLILACGTSSFFDNNKKKRLPTFLPRLYTQTAKCWCRMPRTLKAWSQNSSRRWSRWWSSQPATWQSWSARPTGRTWTSPGWRYGNWLKRLKTEEQSASIMWIQIVDIIDRCVNVLPCNRILSPPPPFVLPSIQIDRNFCVLPFK